MLKERLKTILFGGPEGAQQGAAVQPARERPAAYSRPSHGLEQFFGDFGEDSGLSILDLSGATQANVSFITSRGHRLYTDDILLTLDECFGGGDFFANQSDPARMSRFLDQSLDFHENQFDGALVWDTLQFLTQPLLQHTVDRLLTILKPEASLLAFFHAEEKAASIPLYGYRITDAKTLFLAPRGDRRPAQFFNNRSLEKMFQRARSVKFFLTRDHLREVLVRR